MKMNPNAKYVWKSFRCFFYLIAAFLFTLLLFFWRALVATDTFLFFCSVFAFVCLISVVGSILYHRS